MIDTFTHVFEKNLKSNTRITVNQGGSSSSKTFSILQLLILLAQNSKNNILISIVAETLPHLKRGVIRDFINILGNDYNDNYFNKSDKIYTFDSGSKVEFFSADNSAKLRGARRDYLFINECNRIDYDSFTELEIRTKKRIWLDFNPVQSFWVHKKVLTKKDVTFIKSTYKDNQYLDDNIIKSIESRKQDINWWNVYGLGEVGAVENLVYPKITLVDEMPKDYRWKVYGLDFGFTNDPSAIIEVIYSNGELWLKELLYKRGQTNQDLAIFIKSNINGVIIADSAEPKSIEELRRENVNVKPAEKGKDSIINGIQLINNYKINVLKQSLNLIDEFYNYMYIMDRFNNILNKPIDNYNHLLDAFRYASVFKLKKKNQIYAIS